MTVEKLCDIARKKQELWEDSWAGFKLRLSFAALFGLGRILQLLWDLFLHWWNEGKKQYQFIVRLTGSIHVKGLGYHCWCIPFSAAAFHHLHPQSTKNAPTYQVSEGHTQVTLFKRCYCCIFQKWLSFSLYDVSKPKHLLCCQGGHQLQSPVTNTDTGSNKYSNPRIVNIHEAIFRMAPSHPSTLAGNSLTVSGLNSWLKPCA